MAFRPVYGLHNAATAAYAGGYGKGKNIASEINRAQGNADRSYGLQLQQMQNALRQQEISNQFRQEQADLSQSNKQREFDYRGERASIADARYDQGILAQQAAAAENTRRFDVTRQDKLGQYQTQQDQFDVTSGISQGNLDARIAESAERSNVRKQAGIAAANLKTEKQAAFDAQNLKEGQTQSFINAYSNMTPDQRKFALKNFINRSDPAEMAKIYAADRRIAADAAQVQKTETAESKVKTAAGIAAYNAQEASKKSFQQGIDHIIAAAEVGVSELETEEQKADRIGQLELAKESAVRSGLNPEYAAYQVQQAQFASDSLAALKARDRTGTDKPITQAERNEYERAADAFDTLGRNDKARELRMYLSHTNTGADGGSNPAEKQALSNEESTLAEMDAFIGN